MLDELDREATQGVVARLDRLGGRRRSRPGDRHRRRLRDLRPPDHDARRRRQPVGTRPAARRRPGRSTGRAPAIRAGASRHRRRSSACPTDDDIPDDTRARLPDPAHDGRPHRGRHVAHQPVPDRTAAGLRLAVARLPRRRDRRRPDARTRRRWRRAVADARRTAAACRAAPGSSCCWSPAARSTPADDPRHGQSLSDTGLIASIDPRRAVAPGPARGDGRPAPGRPVGRPDALWRTRRAARVRAATGASRSSSSR